MSLNQCSFIGNLGADPEIRQTQNGDKVANLRLAVSERFKDKNTGERREKTEWVSLTVWGPLAGICEQYLKKGSKIFAQGKLETRSWEDRDGNKRYSTEVVLRGYGGTLTMLDSANGSSGNNRSGDYAHNQDAGPPQDFNQDFEDSIPF